MNTHRKKVGDFGEKLACDWLKQKGYSIDAQNLHYPGGEIDIVATAPDGKLTFFEVKTRRNQNFGSILETMGEQKVQRVVTAVQQYLNTYGYSEDWQIDFLGVELSGDTPKFTHIEHITA